MSELSSDLSVDWEALANDLLGGGSDGSKDPDPAPDGALGDPDPAPGSTEPAATPERTYTRAELEAEAERLASERLSADATAAQNRRSQEEFARLLREGTDEEVAAAVRAAAQDQEARQARSQFAEQAGSEAVDSYADTILSAIMTPEWVGSLTDEEAARIDPAKFSDDASYFKELVALQAEKAAAARDQSEFDKRVEEAVKAKQNNAIAARVTAPSTTQTPAAGEGDGFSHLQGSARLDALWDKAMEEHVERHG